MSQARHVGKVVLTRARPPLDRRGHGADHRRHRRRWARWWRGTWSPSTACATCCWPAGAVPARQGAGELAAELSALGASVRVAACDVADRDAAAALLARYPTPSTR